MKITSASVNVFLLCFIVFSRGSIGKVVIVRETEELFVREIEELLNETTANFLNETSDLLNLTIGDLLDETFTPSHTPTENPTSLPTSKPSHAPTENPTSLPTKHHQWGPSFPNPSTGFPCINVTLDIKPDYYGSETSWVLVDGVKKLFTSPNYKNKAQTEDFGCLEIGDGEYERYMFIIYDSFGDGICCSHGNGSYTLAVDDVDVKTGGEFGESESFTFPVPPTAH